MASNCLKISYKGLTRHIMCDLKFQYNELLKIIMDTFNIATTDKLAIEFYDEQGHKYNKETFEYFLLLFPNPQKIFFIRLDSTKIINPPPKMEDINSIILDNERVPFGKSKLNNGQTANNEPDVYCEAVPVKRQNCFLGEIPASQTTQPQTSTSALTKRNLSQDLSLEIIKRMRLLKQNSPKKKHLNNPSGFKRSLRI